MSVAIEAALFMMAPGVFLLYVILGVVYVETHSLFLERIQGRRQAQCVDKLNNCPDYTTAVCLQYLSWSEENCPDFCGFCGTPPPSTTQCRDLLPLPPEKDKHLVFPCSDYGKRVCIDYQEWSQEYCQAYCGFCGPSFKMLTIPGETFGK